MPFHNRPLRFIFLLSALLFFSPSFSRAQVTIPGLESHVIDSVGLLSSSTRESLNSILKAYDESKGSQIVVLIIESTQGEAIEQLSIRAAEKWKLGRKRIDDGVILVIAKNDRSLRIEVGHGLEGALPDATCKQIIENLITPQFRNGNFDGGVEAGVQAILKKLAGEELPLPQPSSSPDWILFLIIAFWFLIIFYQIRNPGRGRFYSSRNHGYWGGGSSGWSGGGGGGGFSGGGGTFGGGGASGRW